MPRRSWCRTAGALFAVTCSAAVLAGNAWATPNPRNVAQPPAISTAVTAGAATAADATSFPPYARISNGTLALGVNPQGNLDVDTPTDSIGLEFIPTGGDALIPGCYCEGWGVADTISRLSGWADADFGGASNNSSVLRFEVTPTTADSIVDIEGRIRVHQFFHPSTTPNLYQIDVSVQNIGLAEQNIVYRRVMDWDVPPTEFDEFVTLHGTAPLLLDSTDNGFNDPNPLTPLDDLGARGTFTDVGPDDRGGAFDLSLGKLEPGQTAGVTLFYGAAATEAGALDALDSVGAGIYSLGEPNTPDGPTLGKPNTFMFGIQRSDLLKVKPKLIFLAGIAGNEIRKSDCIFLCAVWPQVLAAARYGSDLEVQADGETPSHPTEGGEVFDSVFFHPVYRTALNYFRDMACESACPFGKDLRDFDTFKYDWRIGERVEGARFADRLEQECNHGPLWLVAHSTGGLIIKSAFHQLRQRGIDPKDCLDGGGVFFLATPHLGAPKAVGSIVSAANFFIGTPIASDSLEVLTRDVNNWLTAWQLMPRTSTEALLETFPWYLKPPATKLPREAWFSDGRLNKVGQPLNFALDAKADARLDYHQPLADTIGNVPYYDIFGYRSITPGSYAPETCTVEGNHPHFTHSDTDARVDGVIWGDATVPTWSASWPGQLLDDKHLYGIPLVPHGSIPNDSNVLGLIRQVVESGDASLYPDWAYAHDAGATAAAHPTTRPQYVRARWCSPVAGRAVSGGQLTGFADDGTLLEDIPSSFVDLGGTSSDPQTDVFVGVEPPAQPPAFEARATGTGPVGLIFTGLDEVDHSFMYDVVPGDTSRLADDDGTWRLSVDRGGDGTTDQTVDLGAPSVDFVSTSPLVLARSEVLTARQRGDAAGGTYRWSVSGDAATLSANAGTATLTGVHAPGTVTVTLTFTTDAGAVATYKRDIDIAFAPPYQPAGTTCLGAPGHSVLQPVNPDGSSVFQAGRTVPVKLRVCDAAGNVVSDTVVAGFSLVKAVAGTSVSFVNETPVSATPDTSFRWDPTGQQWIFNLSTKNLASGQTYTYSISLNDGSSIEFTFGLRP
jgi:lecithin:cholesterol acyltransferase